MERMQSGPLARLSDERGRPIGRVIEPRARRLVGHGAETVLLLREPGDGPRKVDGLN